MSGAKKMVPKRRFKEFLNAGDWEQRKLGEFSDITKLAGFEFTKYVVYSDKGNIIALRGLNVKDGDLNLGDVKYIDNSDFTKLKRSKLFRNDILFTYVGTIGEVARIQEDEKYYLAPNVSRIRIEMGLLSEFLMYYMTRDLFYKKIISPLIATSSQPALSMANIREFKITYPSDINEQQKIAIVFSRISQLITLHQRKLDKLQATKKALLQEMFPEEGQDKPKRRFKGFTDAWEQRKLDDIAKIKTGGGTPKTANPEYWSGNIPWIQSSDLVEGDIVHVNINKFINNNALKNSAAKLISRDSIALVTRVGVGKVAVINQDFTTSQDFLSLSDFDESDIKFLAYQLYRLMQENAKVLQGTSIKGITKTELIEQSISIPSSSQEQNLISNVLLKIDSIITLHQRKLDKLKNLKQAYLNEMFV